MLDARCVLDVAPDFPRPSQSVTKIMIWIRDLTIQSPLGPGSIGGVRVTLQSWSEEPSRDDDKETRVKYQ